MGKGKGWKGDGKGLVMAPRTKERNVYVDWNEARSGGDDALRVAARCGVRPHGTGAAVHPLASQGVLHRGRADAEEAYGDAGHNFTQKEPGNAEYDLSLRTYHEGITAG